jgi:prevent-host-death family protein
VPDLGKTPAIAAKGHHQMTVGLLEAKQKLSQLIKRASNGHEIIIPGHGEKQAGLVPTSATLGPRRTKQSAPPRRGALKSAD